MFIITQKFSVPTSSQEGPSVQVELDLHTTSDRWKEGDTKGSALVAADVHRGVSLLNRNDGTDIQLEPLLGSA